MLLNYIVHDPNGLGNTTYSAPPSTPDEQVLEVNGCGPAEFVLYREWPAWAWPGGYPLYLITYDGATLCPQCANENIDLTLNPEEPQWFVTGQEVNWECADLICDHCNCKIESAYEVEHE